MGSETRSIEGKQRRHNTNIEEERNTFSTGQQQVTQQVLVLFLGIHLQKEKETQAKTIKSYKSHKRVHYKPHEIVLSLVT